MKVLVVDDHPMFLMGVTSMIEQNDMDIEVLQAENIQQALTLLAANTGLDIVVTDLQMPEGSGIDLITKMKDLKLEIPILVISASEKIAHVAEALDAGASGFISKSAQPAEMIDAVQNCASGNECIDPMFIEALAEHRAARESVHLTKRQIEIIQHMNAGDANKKIAFDLNISEATVKNHIRQIFQELSVFNRVECLTKARELGVID